MVFVRVCCGVTPLRRQESGPRRQPLYVTPEVAGTKTRDKEASIEESIDSIDLNRCLGFSCLDAAVRGALSKQSTISDRSGTMPGVQLPPSPIEQNQWRNKHDLSRGFSGHHEIVGFRQFF